MTLPDGTVLGFRYRLGAPLGRGGAACTYLADDLLERGQVALKLLAPARPIAELRREFERLRGLWHPHLARVRDFAIVRALGERRAFYTAEVVRGGDLRSFVARAGFAAARGALGDVLDALHLLHQSGLRHGDVKPENVLVDEAGHAVLIDLGCAAPLGQAAPVLSGTPGYLAPELTAGRAADERADLFAFGVMLRELGARRTWPEWAPLLTRLTAEAPGDRPSSARELLALLGDARDVACSTHGRAARCVGRDAQLEAAGAALAAVARGAAGPRCVWIEGPPGVGRSRFLRELCFAAASAESELLEAGAHEASPVRAALSRKYGALAPGFEPLLEQLAEAGGARETSLFVLDDAQRLGPDAALELALALRALPERGRFGALIASTEPPPALDPARLLRVELAPLELPALAEWAGDTVAPARLGALQRFTGGYPRYVEQALAALVAGRMRELDLADAAPSAGEQALALDVHSARALSLALAGLSSSEERALAEIAILGKTDRTSLTTLLARDLVTVRGGQLALTRDADRAALLARLEPGLTRALHERAARELCESDEPETLAAAVEHFVRAELRPEAQRLFERAGPIALRAPRVFAQRLAPCAGALTSPQQVALAQLLRLSGEAPRALSLLAQARRAAGPATHALYREAAEVYLALGRAQRAEHMLARCGDDPRHAAAHAELTARVLVRRGAYARARDIAARALEADPRGPHTARLHEALALALAYLGEHRAAREQIERALALHALDDLRTRARSTALSGFVLLRAGAAAEAAEAYGRALALAEAGGLADLVANALANLASARQSLGQWGGALSTYERALRLARALGRSASERTLRANLANLALEIGAFARAEGELAALEQGVETAALELSITLYRAELALLTGDAERALAYSAPIAVRPEAPARERIEARVLALFALTALGQRERAAEELAALAPGEGTALDLLARVAEVEAHVLGAQGGASHAREAVRRLEAALERVRPSGDQALIARLETELSTHCRRLAAEALGAEHAAHARARWERIALDLPPTLREAFWAHPRRQPLVRAAAEEARGRSSISLARIRELNRRLGSLQQRDEVLAFALDAAIELTGAERGFVLLQKQGERGFEVALAQHMDRARMRKSEWKWSRSIAERVIREGEPVLTVDAGRDPRFARQASVHAMQLKSVLCAPIRDRSGVRGALYLDNRLARARFAQEDAELLLAFADQVAIALLHADLVRELEEKARELLREKRKVEELARGQAREIERLSDELAAQKAALAHRYDYASLVGRSEPMRRVLAILDRVIDTDLAVLVQGESGTGKELVARAIHFNSRRKDKPFVSVNCAALPEALLESELFGHVKGAFTGAVAARDGLFVTARGGTLLLDELGEMPMSMQAKLLRVLNDGEVRPVGGTKSFAVDVRLVCATNRNLKERVAAGLFRQDLYYRVSVVELTLPSLRERQEDIVPIAEALLRRRAEETGEPACRLTPDTVRALLAHPWPGNVRELQNTLLRASVMAPAGVIRSEDLGLAQAPRPAVSTASNRSEYLQRDAERLLAALEAERWNVSKVAKNLGIPRNTLYRRLHRYGIQRSGE